MKVVGIVLAAGAGTRYGGPKALARRGSVRFVDLAVRTLHQSGVTEVLVISGAWEGPVPGAEVVHNPQWQEGVSTSLRCALTAAAAKDADQVVITLVDLPDLTAEQVRSILDTPGDLVQATYDGVPGHPVKLARAHFEAVAEAAQGDQGARQYLLTHDVQEVALAGSLRDVDEPPPA